MLALSLAALLGLGLFNWAKVVQQQKATEAAGLVKKLVAAETARIPEAIKELTPYRQWDLEG